MNRTRTFLFALLTAGMAACTGALAPDDSPDVELAKGGDGKGGGNAGGPGGGDSVLGTLTFRDAAGDVFRSDGNGSYQVQVDPTIRILTGDAGFTPDNVQRCVQISLAGLYPSGDDTPCPDLGMVEKWKHADDVVIHEMGPGESGLVSFNSWFTHGSPEWNLKYGIECPGRWGSPGSADDGATRATVESHADVDGDGFADSWTISMTQGNACQRGKGKALTAYENVPAALSFDVVKTAN